jgi:hypothetical protein
MAGLSPMLLVSSAQTAINTSEAGARHSEAGAAGRDAGRGAAAEAARDHDRILPIESDVTTAHFADAYKRGSRHAQPSS